jgi:hypothetical protein
MKAHKEGSEAMFRRWGIILVPTRVETIDTVGFRGCTRLFAGFRSLGLGVSSHSRGFPPPRAAAGFLAQPRVSANSCGNPQTAAKQLRVSANSCGFI